MCAAAGELAANLTEIGHICSGAGVTWSMNGAEFFPISRGYEHFSLAYLTASPTTQTQITVYGEPRQ
jgi:hypothetical protein